MRWWDGFQWTANTRLTDAMVSTDPSATARHSAPGYAHPTGGLGLRCATSTSAHQYSLITFGVTALHLIIAFITHYVLIRFVTPRPDDPELDVLCTIYCPSGAILGRAESAI
jgi:hypothetical protein